MKQEIKRQAALTAALETINERVNEMRTKHNQLADEYKNQQDLFLGNASTFEQPADSESALQTAVNALRLLEDRQAQLQSAIAEADEADARNELLQTAKQSGIEAEAALNGYVQTWKDIDRAITSLGNQLIDTFADFSAKRNKFTAAFNELGAGAKSELEAIGFSNESHQRAIGELHALPATPFAETIRHIEIHFSNQRQGAKSAAAAASDPGKNA